ncbi:hypothetical protein QN379_00535 [Glaciimonas sp. Gout2]|uniref:hypothetical protein n=1 Tax=unclassified Glaciimonas TaxID=2644401 RepID=UPI002B23B366|nr:MULTISPECIES: hypothetical protein [unclassified Glaciimonas]MEB0012309.1 hypothetical protein [Glaciimonas sp. Cout2]MEB0080504.1 hypothetical protein [Glaciimonas sp. Gout2]
MRNALTRAAFGLAIASLAPLGHAHAVAGDRIFPATMAVDDPGVGDELDFQFGHIRTPNDDGNTASVNSLSVNYAKTITSNLAISVGTNYTTQRAAGDPTVKGFDNLRLGIKYMAYVNPVHEFLLSVGIDTDIGGTGSKAIGSSYSTYTPTIYAGKGFGDLPEALRWLKPLAITGTVGQQTASNSNVPNALNWGMTLQYSLPYLQSFVKNVGLSKPFANMIPIVELAMSTCTSGSCSGHTTGTINPGVIWESRLGQIGLEAQIPANSASGHGIGVLIQTHIFFDDMFPHSVGKPIF